MDEIKVCDMCGSSNVEIVKNRKPLHIPFEPDSYYTQTVFMCRDCEEGIDVTDEDEKRKDIANAEKHSLEVMLDYITNQNYSYASIERALDLPPRTISRWKSGQEPSAAGLTLLRFLRIYPWLISVAENNFDEIFSKKILFNAIAGEVEKINQSLSKNYEEYSWAMVQQVKTDDISTGVVVGGYSNATTNSNNTLSLTAEK